MTRVTIPQLDANLIDVTITNWRKTEGESITQGEIIAELTTDKAAYELEAPASGHLIRILATAKSVVPTGYIVALIGEKNEYDNAADDENNKRMSAYRGDTTTKKTNTETEHKSRVRAIPKARRLARKHNLVLEDIQQKTGIEVVDEKTVQQFINS
jgi:pyruvate/2-oxoglutarate dehydrogenase complex dihydrolipoamide acyltransferase (E2) component